MFTPAPGTRPTDDARLDALEGWAGTFGAEVQVELVDNWNWTGDAMARVNALEARVAALERRGAQTSVGSSTTAPSNQGTQSQNQPGQDGQQQGESQSPTGPTQPQQPGESPQASPTASPTPAAVSPPPATPVPTPTPAPLEDRFVAVGAFNDAVNHPDDLWVSASLQNWHNFAVRVGWACSGEWHRWTSNSDGSQSFETFNGPDASGTDVVEGTQSRDSPRIKRVRFLVVDRDSDDRKRLSSDYSCRRTSLERA